MCVYPQYVVHMLCIPALTVTFNVDDHFHVEMIVNINVIILERGLAESIEEI